MTHILGVVGSDRRWGNCDLLVRQALKGAQEKGAVGELLRLTDLRLDPCTGCLRCVIADKPCPIDDHMHWLIERLQAADGLILAAPTYFLGPAAVVKLVIDRLLMVAGRVDRAPATPRPAITLVTAGLQDWRGVTLPYLNALVWACGFQPIESVTAIAPGPGEVLLDDEVMAKTLDAGRRLASRDLEPSPVPRNVCPVCRCDCFVFEGSHVTCPICGTQGVLEQQDGHSVLRFGEGALTEHRWTAEGLRDHMFSWVMATGPRYLANRDEIKLRRHTFRETEVRWIHPGTGPGP